MSQLKHTIQQHIQHFSCGSLVENALNLFETLGYRSDIRMRVEPNTAEQFLDVYDAQGIFDEKRRERAKCAEWTSVDFLFQLTGDDITHQNALFEVNEFDPHQYHSYLFFALELQNDAYPRGALATITREVNRLFLMPAMILFKYGSTLTFSIINRRLSKTDASKDVLEKVTLIKDIRIDSPHRAHLDILCELSLEEVSHRHAVTNFLELHQAWQQVLDIQELNTRFFRELANWYFWAVQQVEFPDDDGQERDIRNATSVIRLLTRLIFVWFLKEKHLIPAMLFDKHVLDEHLKYDDSTGSTYYKAILQNLFFATLNTEMQKDNPNSRTFVNRRYGIQAFYRYKRFFHDPDKALELFREIPFLNGGLFENLDKNVGTNHEVRIDCFSNRPVHEPRLKVPDVLFFGGEQQVDLSAVYGDKKRKKETVRGLISILNAYKFTIAENTPIEEEIALDPELLGKVFENLLASYNPETQTTARKQTGSFYTPREIVDYMVDESLIAYLMHSGAQSSLSARPSRPSSQSAGRGGSNGWEDTLRRLLSYSEEPHDFSDEEVNLLIQAINRCKILDPACGSGAFPMGVLHKLVHLLHQLDPDNTRWKQRQIESQTASITADIEHAEQIQDDKARNKALEELHEKLASINEAFDENDLDYSRKLYLIEHCIYGVDIQPIAVQIAKLRFFISLIVDQTVKPHKPNLGILPLPNLETKFVAANTLIGIEKPQQMGLRNPEIDQKEAELKDVRQRHFAARTPQTKEKYRQKDEELRRELAALLKKDGFPADVTEQLAHWNPYDQNASAGFFDPEWMFGLKDGFDIVIGNPPYIQIQNMRKGIFELERQKFTTFSPTADLYCLFYEKGVRLLKEKGILTFITSNKWMTAKYGKYIRKFLVDHANPLLLIDFGKARIFGEATVFVNILMLQDAPNEKHTLAVKLPDEYRVQDVDLSAYVPKHGTVLHNLTGRIWKIVNDEQRAINERIEQDDRFKKISELEHLPDWNIQFYAGIKTGYNKAFHLDQATRDELIAKDPKSADIIKPLLRGRDIKRYHYQFAQWYMLFVPWHFPLHENPTITSCSEEAEIAFQQRYSGAYEHLNSFRSELAGRNKAETGIRYEWYALQRYGSNYYQFFKEPKLIWIEISNWANYAYDDQGMYLTNSAYFMTGKNLKYLLAVLNSDVADYFFFQVTAQIAGGRKRYTKQYVEQIPVPIISKAEQRPFENIVDYVLFLRHEADDIAYYSRYFEHILNAMVYELYFEEIIKDAGRDLIRHIRSDVPDFPVSESQEAKRNAASALYERLHHQAHPVRNSVFFLNSLKVIKEIETTIKSNRRLT